MKPDDKPQKTTDSYEDPKLFIIVGDEKFPRPALETAFVDYSEINDKAEEWTKVKVGRVIQQSNVNTIENPLSIGGCMCDFVSRVICSCNKMKPTCSCHGHCSHSVRSGGGSIVTGCRCAPVH